MIFDKVLLLKIAIFTSYGFVVSSMLSVVMLLTGRNFFSSLEMFIWVFVMVLIFMFLVSILKKLMDFKNAKIEDLVPNNENINTFLFGMFLNIANSVAYVFILILIANRVQSIWGGVL